MQMTPVTSGNRETRTNHSESSRSNGGESEDFFWVVAEAARTYETSVNS
jgi:hypothetical protein